MKTFGYNCMLCYVWGCGGLLLWGFSKELWFYTETRNSYVSFLENQTFNDIFKKYWQISLSWVLGITIIKYYNNTLPNRNGKMPNYLTTAKWIILITHNLTLIIGIYMYAWYQNINPYSRYQKCTYKWVQNTYLLEYQNGCWKFPPYKVIGRQVFFLLYPPFSCLEAKRPQMEVIAWWVFCIE